MLMFDKGGARAKAWISCSSCSPAASTPRRRLPKRSGSQGPGRGLQPVSVTGHLFVRPAECRRVPQEGRIQPARCRPLRGGGTAVALVQRPAGPSKRALSCGGAQRGRGADTTPPKACCSSARASSTGEKRHTSRRRPPGRRSVRSLPARDAALGTEPEPGHVERDGSALDTDSRVESGIERIRDAWRGAVAARRYEHGRPGHRASQPNRLTPAIAS